MSLDSKLAVVPSLNDLVPVEAVPIFLGEVESLKTPRRKRGQGRIFRRSESAPWHICYCWHGKEIRESARTLDRTEAEMLLGNRLAQIKYGDMRQVSIPAGHVYFLQDPQTTHIKIGFSSNYAKRTASISSARATGGVLLAKVPGIMATEKAIQQAFSKYRVRGEWFRCSNELANFINLFAA